MTITINGQSKEFTNSETLKDIITSISPENSKVIAEVNGNIIKSTQWDETSIKDGDTIELVSFVGGG